MTSEDATLVSAPTGDSLPLLAEVVCQEASEEGAQLGLGMQAEGVVAATEDRVGVQLLRAAAQLFLRLPAKVFHGRLQLLVERAQGTPATSLAGGVLRVVRDPRLFLDQQLGRDRVDGRAAVEVALRVAAEVAQKSRGLAAIVGAGRVGWKRQQQRSRQDH